MEEPPLVPPRPPEPGATANAAPPAAPKPPAVEEPIEPAGGVAQRTKPTTPAPAAPATAAAPAATNFAPIKKLSDAAAAKAKTLAMYEAKFARRENVDGTPGPLEEVAFKFREPMTVYMKNVSEAGLGREVLYNPGQHGDKIHIVVGKGDSRLVKAGFKPAPQSPDSPTVRSKSRHSIRESGIGISAGKFVALVAKVETGKLPAETLKYAGDVKREDFADGPLVGVEEIVRKGDEGLPSGGTRHWFFDAKPGSASEGLPVLVILYDANGKELEYYKYSQLKIAKLADADFDPAKLGGK
jgi:hypothetical protein